jgi:uncharacterized protein YjdB
MPFFFVEDPNAPVSVTSVTLNPTTKSLSPEQTFQPTVTVLPENATNKDVTWKSLNENIATVNTTGLITAKEEGATKIVVTTVDKAFTDTLHLTVAQTVYTDGVFFVNEDMYPSNGTINFLDEGGVWHYRVYQEENPGKKLGITSPYGTIYGDKLFITSKQASTGESRLAVCNPETMKSLAEFVNIGDEDAEGRAFLGVDEHKGYVGTSNGIYTFNMDNLTIGNVVKGTKNTTGSQYTGQIGTMVRVADKVFAVHQEKGVLVIDIKGDSVLSVVNAPLDGSVQRGFGSMVLSKDGNLWLSVATDVSGMSGSQDYMMKLNPYTLATTRIDLPAGAAIPNSWFAWTADAFCASTQNNKLYWKNDGGWVNKENIIYEYDIDNNQTRTVINLSMYDTGNWEIYGAGFRLDPRTDDIYAPLAPGAWGAPPYKVAKITTGGTIADTYPMSDHYWFPSIPVFHDKHAPVVAATLTDVTLAEEVKIYLNDKVSDADNFAVGIVKTIVSISNDNVLKAQVRNDSLILSPTHPGISNVELQFNSNGKLVRKTITVTVPDSHIGVDSIILNEYTLILDEEETFLLIATVLPENATNKNVTWSSANNNVATVDNGLVTAIAKGIVNITVTTEDGNHSATCEVTVNERIGIETLEKLMCKLYPTATTGLLHVVVPETTTDVIQIIDITGKVVQTIRPQSSETVIDITSCPAGMYLIRIGNYVGKVIKTQ